MAMDSPKVLPRPAMPNDFMPYRPPTPEKACHSRGSPPAGQVACGRLLPLGHPTLYAYAGEEVGPTSKKTESEDGKSEDESNGGGEEFNEEEMEEFERMLKDGSDSPSNGKAAKDGDNRQRMDDPDGDSVRQEDEEEPEDKTEASDPPPSEHVEPLQEADPVKTKDSPVQIKQEIIIEDYVSGRERQSITPPIKFEPIDCGIEAVPSVSSEKSITDEHVVMESDPATLHMRGINRPLSKSDARAYFYPYMPLTIKIRKPTWSDTWEAFFQFKSQKSKDKAMRHGHLSHKENPLETLGYGHEDDGEEDIDPKLYFEDENGKVVELEGVMKKHVVKQPPLEVQESSKAQTSASQQGSKGVAQVPARVQQPQSFPKIKLNLQQLQNLLRDQQSGLQKNAQGQYVLQMPKHQITEKLKLFSTVGCHD
jgi:hypothetical protein